jgi:hypothetical protein
MTIVGAGDRVKHTNEMNIAHNIYSFIIYILLEVLCHPASSSLASTGPIVGEEQILLDDL